MHHGNQAAFQTQGPLPASGLLPGSAWAGGLLISLVPLWERGPCAHACGGGGSPGTTPRTALGTEDLIMYGSPSTQVGMINPILQMSKLRLLCLLRGKVAKLGARTSGLLPESPEGLCLSALPQPRAAAPPIPATPPALQDWV